MVEFLAFYRDGVAFVACAPLPMGQRMLMASGEVFHGHLVGVDTGGRGGAVVVLYLPEEYLTEEAMQAHGPALREALGLAETTGGR